MNKNLYITLSVNVLLILGLAFYFQFHSTALIKDLESKNTTSLNELRDEVKWFNKNLDGKVTWINNNVKKLNESSNKLNKNVSDSIDILKVESYGLVDVSKPLEFSGETQFGVEIHKLHIMQISFPSSNYSRKQIANDYYLVYSAGSEYGPHLLQKMSYHRLPILKKLNENTISVEFIKQGEGLVNQKWKLIGHTAELIAPNIQE